VHQDTLLASMQGYAPQVAVEFGRKVLFSTERPTFAELESHVKGRRRPEGAHPSGRETRPCGLRKIAALAFLAEATDGR
jgi:hypothetical protein